MKEDRKEIYRAVLLASQLGWWMVGAILGGFLLGYWLDRWFGSGPVLLILFTILGIGVGGWKAYRLVMKQVDDRGQR